MILRAGRSGWWIETELQNRFQPDIPKWNLEFWGQMTGCLDFRVGKEKWGNGLGPSICLLTNGFEHHKCYG